MRRILVIVFAFVALIPWRLFATDLVGLSWNQNTDSPQWDLVAVNPSTGRTTWLNTFPDTPIGGSFTVALDGSRAFVRGTVGGLYQFELPSGRLLRTTSLSYDFTNEIVLTLTALSTDTLFGFSHNLTTGTKQLITVDARNGQTQVLNRLSFARDLFYTSRWFTVAPNGTRAFALSNSNTLYVFRMPGGELISSSPLNIPTSLDLQAIRALSVDTLMGVAYNRNTQRNELRSIAVSTGQSTLLKSFTLDTGWNFESFTLDPVALRAFLVSGDQGDTLYEFDLTNGNLSTRRSDRYLAFLGAVVEEEGPVTPPQTSFWSEIRSDLSALPIRSIPSTSGNTPIKQLPNGWAIEVTSVYDSNGNIVTGNGYRWYQVKDGTDGTTGWMPAGRWQNGAFVGAPFLPDDLPNQASLELDATGTYDSRKERANAISVLFENYYNEDNSDSTLWGGIANAYLKKNAFPVQVIAAMTLRESGGIDFDNDCVTWDYGHGIKQVTSRNYIGGASKVSIPQCEGSDNKRKACYTPINPANERSPKRYTITERYYTNTALGMAANVKDGFNVLVEKHQGSIKAIPPNGRTWKAPTDQYITENPSYIDSQYVVSETEMRVLRTTRAYNGLGPDCLRFNVAEEHEYLRPVADLMAKVHENFPTLPKDGESPPFTDLAEKMRKVELDKENISLCSPGVLRIIDEEGRVTGFVGADLIDEIPTVVYDTEAGKAAVVHLIDQRFRYQVVGTEEGVYTLYIDKTTQDDVVTVQLINVPLLLGEVYTYSVDWQAVRRGEKGVQVEIDREGDGTPEEVFTVGASVDDTVPPTTTHKRYGGTIYLNADDGEGVGVSAVAVSLNGDSWKKVSGVRAQVTLGVGENHLRFYATDHLGNTEAVQSLTAYVQGSDPTPIPAITPWGFVILFLTLPGIAGIALRMRVKGRGKGTGH